MEMLKVQCFCMFLLVLRLKRKKLIVPDNFKTQDMLFPILHVSCQHKTQQISKKVF